MLLAGDIGGTKTNLAIFSSERGPLTPLARATFPSAHYPSLEALASEFLAGGDYHVDRASFGVAGPVVDGQAKITNLPWLMDETALARALNVVSVRLLNDLAAIAHGVTSLGANDLHSLNTGEGVTRGAIAVIAPGTGLGEAFLTWESDHYHAHGSEGGHADYAPVDELQLEMLRVLQKRYGHVSFERVCSGRGLPNIYTFLRDSGHAPEPAWLTDELAGAEDMTPVIVRAATQSDRPCALCAATVDMFVQILAAEAGNLALKVMATGGVYLGGGMPPRILDVIDKARFMQTFSRKGRFSEVLSRVPVKVILTPDVALTGAAVHGLEASPD